MKKIYISLITLIGCFMSYGQIVAIPDTNFKKALLSQGLDKNKNGEIEKGEVHSLEELNVSNKNIKDLTGIEAFIMLFRLDCSKNALKSINFPNNSVITRLNISSNQMSTLNLSKVPMLSELNCSENQLDTLDLGRNSSINTLYCSKNQLRHLDVSRLNLYQFDCSNNMIGSLDLQKSTSLYSISCSSNALTGTLDVSNSKELVILACDYNQLTGLKLPSTSSLETLHCNNNKIAELDLTNAGELTTLYCNNNVMSSLNVTKSPKLAHLLCLSNKLTGLDVTYQANLTQLDASGNSGLSYICVKDAALAATNTKYVKDATTQWTEDCNIVTSTNDDEHLKSLVISPNPSQETFMLNLPEAADIVVSTLEGKLIEQFNHKKNVQFGSGYGSGIYVVMIKLENTSTAIRIVKQ